MAYDFFGNIKGKSKIYTAFCYGIEKARTSFGIPEILPVNISIAYIFGVSPMGGFFQHENKRVHIHISA
jgi:hypothetical protein